MFKTVTFIKQYIFDVLMHKTIEESEAMMRFTIVCTFGTKSGVVISWCLVYLDMNTGYMFMTTKETFSNELCPTVHSCAYSFSNFHSNGHLPMLNVKSFHKNASIWMISCTWRVVLLKKIWHFWIRCKQSLKKQAFKWMQRALTFVWSNYYVLRTYRVQARMCIFHRHLYVWKVRVAWTLLAISSNNAYWRELLNGMPHVPQIQKFNEIHQKW